MQVIVKDGKDNPVDNIGGKLCAVVVVGKKGAHFLLRGTVDSSAYISLINGLNEVKRIAIAGFTEEKAKWRTKS